MSETWTTLKVLEWTAGRFARAGLESSRLEAQVLLAKVLDCDRVALYTSFDKPLRDDELATYRELIRRRLAREPVAYLVGEQEFWSLPFEVNEHVLIPRRDSETVIQAVMDRHEDREASLSIADIATGSGALAVTLAVEFSHSTVVGTDVSPDAVALASANAARNRVGDRVSFRQGNLLEPLADQQFDVVVANLPYVPSRDIDELSPEVRREPRLALDGGVDGLDLIRRLCGGVAAHLKVGGLVVLEHGADQGPAVAALLDDAGELGGVSTVPDLAGLDRVTLAFRS